MATAAGASPGYDLVVVGGGPGGYVAAIRAAQLGLRVAVIEREHLGGICANWGCIPTKALLHSAELFAALKKGADHGIVCDGLRFDYGKAVASSRKVADNQQRGVAMLFKKNKIEHIAGTATLQRDARGPSLRVDGRELRAPHIILATGARPKTLPSLTPDGKQILTYFEAMNLPAQPKSLCIVGAGAIGVEFAYFYNAIGTQVTLLEALPQILPILDRVEQGLHEVERDLEAGLAQRHHGIGNHRQSGQSGIGYQQWPPQSRFLAGFRQFADATCAETNRGRIAPIANERHQSISICEAMRRRPQDGRPLQTRRLHRSTVQPKSIMELHSPCFPHKTSAPAYFANTFY